MPFMSDYDSLLGKQIYLLINLSGHHTEQNFFLPDTVVSGMSISLEGILVRETEAWLHLSGIKLHHSDRYNLKSGMVKKEYVIGCFEREERD